MAEANLHAIISIAGMPIKEDMVLNSLSVTENGSYTPEEGVDGFSEVTVDVQPILTDLSVTENGTYKAEDYGAYGFNEVTTNIFTGYTVDEIASGNISGDITGETTQIVDYAFAKNPYISSAYFPNVTSIGIDGFYFSTGLVSADFPSIEFIGHYGFSGCSSLKNINISNVKQVDDQAFLSCSKLKSVSIPNVEDLSYSVFSSCIALEKVDLRNYQGSLDETAYATLRGAFKGCLNLKYVAFQNLINGFRQTNVNPPFDVLSLRDVDKCYLIFDMMTPPKLSMVNGLAYDTTRKNKLVICVPQSSLSDWQNATNWASMNIVSIESMENELKGQFDWLDEKYWSN